jgi:acetyltransferase-like isoleucine patch superfamily enzyme
MHTPDKLAYALRLLTSDPFELLRLLHVGWTTAKYRYLRRCVGPGTTVEPGVQILNAANVQIGRDCLFKEGIYLRAGAQGRITIGDRAAINGFCKIYGHGTVTIGEDAQLGPGVLITTTGHDYRGQLETSFSPVVIGRRVWIGANVTVLPGVEIGDEAVIGAGSVVTKSIPPRVVAVGVPARVIKSIEPAHAPLRELEVAV